MKRSHFLLMGIGIVFVVAVGLRVRSQFARTEVSLEENGSARTKPALILVPRDYVVDPMVVPDEADNGPSRIISLAPSITEVVCALGMRDRLVGRSTYSTYPPGIESVIAVGSLVDANLPKIKGLNPDLILVTTNSGPLIDKLAKLELRYEMVPHGSLADVYESIEKVGTVCDRRETARLLVRAIRDDMASLSRWVEASDFEPRRVVVVFGALPVPPGPVFVAGPGIFLDALVEQAGHINVAREVLKSPHGEIPLEKLRVLDPDVILEFRMEVSDQTMRDLYTSWSEVGTLEAIRRQQVRSLGGEEWLSAGPRIAIELHHFITVLSEFR